MKRYNEGVQYSHNQNQETPLLPDWFYQEAGRFLLDQQINALSALIPDRFYQVGLQIGYTDLNGFAQF